MDLHVGLAGSELVDTIFRLIHCRSSVIHKFMAIVLVIQLLIKAKETVTRVLLVWLYPCAVYCMLD